MNIEIWSIGSKNDSYIEEGVQHYFKRIKHYCPISLQIIPAPKRNANTTVQQSLAAEEKLVHAKLTNQHYLILMDETGSCLNSIQWAASFQHLMNQSYKTVVLLIGGPWGVSESIKQRANAQWSLSKLVFPHQIVRLILAEQIYRSFSIIHNSSYHHE